MPPLAAIGGPFSPDVLQAIAQRQAQSAPAPAMTDRKEPLWPYAALLAGQGADIGSTFAATHTLGLEEKNPLGVTGVMAGKAAGTAALAYLMHKYAEAGDTHTQKLLGIIGGALGVAPALWNVHQIQKAKR